MPLLKVNPQPPRPVKIPQLSFVGNTVVPALMVGFVLVLACAAHDYGVQNPPTFAQGSSFVSIALFISGYWCLLHMSRMVLLGPYYACEMLWGCNFSLVMSALGMVTNRPILVGAGCCIVAVDQLCWYIDAIGYFSMGVFPIGVTKYLVDPKTTLLHKITGTHHLWFMPVILYVLRSIGMPEWSYAFSVFLTSVLVVVCRLCTPFSVDEGHGIKVFNINLAYEFWDDVKLPLVHLMDHQSPVIYLGYLVVLCNLVLNVLPVYIMYTLAGWVHAYAAALPAN